MDIDGNTVPEGTPISVLITAGPGGGEHLDTLGNGPVEVETDGFGMATIVLHSGTKSGTVRIRAQANDSVLSNSTQIMVSAGPPKYIVVAAEECNAPLWSVVGEYIGVIAVVSDTFHNPVNDSTVVYFTADEGTMVSHLERTRDLQGVANSIWISGYASNANPTPDGDVWIYAETYGGTVKDSTMFFNTGGLNTITFNSSYEIPDAMWADGTSEAAILLYGWDLNVNPVANGTAFRSSASKLTVGSGSFEYLCGNLFSVAEIKIGSSKLELDESMPGGDDDGIGYVDRVSIGSVYSKSVSLLTGDAYKSQCNIIATTDIRTGERAFIDVTIKDRWSNPLGDHTIVAYYPATGTPGPGTKETNKFGEAYGFTWIPGPSDTGKFLITVVDTDPRGGVSLSTSITVSP
ncbi:MAG: hypothetical protein ABIJ12_01605 [bacterium]